jgi:hypothetical protein
VDFSKQVERVWKSHATWNKKLSWKEPAQKRFDDYIDAVRKDLSLPSLKVLRAGAPSRTAPPPSSPPGTT